MQEPRAADHPEQKAGPPFQMPFTSKLSVDPVDRWRLHLDLLDASKALVDSLSSHGQTEHLAYLRSLMETDLHTRASIEAILGGRPAPVSAARRHH